MDTFQENLDINLEDLFIDEIGIEDEEIVIKIIDIMDFVKDLEEKVY